MRSTSGSNITVRRASPDDLAPVKHLADQHRHELGFVLLPSLREQIDKGEMLVAVQAGQVVGFVDYHIRRDNQLTLYHIAVHPDWQRHGLGRMLLNSLETIARAKECGFILLKCPTDLDANEFYATQGYTLRETSNGRKRPLNVWMLSLNP
jgi:GNAT superfamily N-acetyltransferase